VTPNEFESLETSIIHTLRSFGGINCLKINKPPDLGKTQHVRNRGAVIVHFLRYQSGPHIPVVSSVSLSGIINPVWIAQGIYPLKELNL
jgi:hypothetical protein